MKQNGTMKWIELLKLLHNRFKEWRKGIISYYRSRIKYPIRRFFEFLSIWFSYFKVCKKVFDFDYSGILEVERNQIERTKRTITKFHNHLDWERDVQRMNLALKLLSIAMEEDSIAEQVSGHHWTEGPDEHGLYEWKSDAKYETTKYVNIRNAYRFSKMPMECYTDSNIRGLNLDHLRVEKAWYLYHKLRTYCLRQWWD